MNSDQIKIMYQPKKKESAFTLVELAIVLVIVGLIIAGVITGRDLIELAKIRSQIQQFQDLERAVITFKLKYGGMPGDIKNATTVLSYSGIIVNGNGDKQVNPLIHPDVFYSASRFRTSDEVSQFFTHLVASKFDLGITPSGNTFNKGADFPLLKLYDNVGYYVAYAAVQDGNNTGIFNPVIGAVGGLGHFIWPNVMESTITHNTLFGVQNPTSGRFWLSKHAEAIDAKIDDGNGIRGKFFAPWFFWGSSAIYLSSFNNVGWDYQSRCRDNSGNYLNLNEDSNNSVYTSDKGHCYVAYRITE